jgi:hypothetical protein
MRRQPPLVLISLKKLNEEYLPIGECITVDIRYCSIPFWLQLDQDECPRKQFLLEVQPFKPNDAGLYTTRGMLRVRKPESDSDDDVEKPTVSNALEKKKSAAKRKSNTRSKQRGRGIMKKHQTRSTTRKQLSDSQSDSENSFESKERDLAERERRLIERETLIDKKEVESNSFVNNFEAVNSTRTKNGKIVEDVTDEFVRKGYDQVTVLKLAEAAEKERHARAMEEIRHDSQEVKLQLCWFDAIRRAPMNITEKK